MNRAEIVSPNLDPEMLRKDETFKKFQRVGLFQSTLKHLGSSKPSTHYYAKISEFKNDVFVLGDNSILFSSLPKKFTDLVDMDYLFAVSSKRIYSSTIEEFGPFSLRQVYDFNALIIDQSKLYICSGNKNLLENSVYYYRELKKSGLIIGLRYLLFNGRK